MRKKNFKTLIYVVIASLCLGGGIYYSMLKNTNDDFLETSVLTILNAVNEKFETDVPADLAIEDVTLEKIHDPTSSFNYYKYKATMVVKNYGGTLVNAKVVLNGGDNQRHSFVRNTSKGFYLQNNGIYTISDYDVIFDGRYNGGKITLTIDVKDKPEVNPGNNSVTFSILEFPPKIKDIALKNISDDKSFVIDFQSDPDFKNYNFEILTTRQYSFPEDELKYAETSGAGHVYGYYRAQNNSDIVNSRSWQNIQSLSKDVSQIKFTENPFTDIDEHYLYLKAVNPENGYYVVSNIVKFPRYAELTYSDFAEIFMEYTGASVANSSALYGAYLPNKIITRGEVLKSVLDAYELSIPRYTGDNYFEDISSENTLYPYAAVIYKRGLWHIFGYRLNPESSATIDYLKYLIYAYREDR